MGIKNSISTQKRISRICILLFFCLLAVSVGNIYAQQEIAVNGTVFDSAGESIPGATVVIKGTTKGTLTDMDGKFSLHVAGRESVLSFSHIGYETTDIMVGNQTVLNVTLQEKTTLIDEVVVVGYGTQKKVNLTGSVETVKGDQIIRQPVAQASQALMGLSPGLTVIQESGQPGADEAKLRIRGIGSIDASTDPLILIDGVEGDMNSINPNDIDNISILKDASSAAIYGARASNGVILVTTKRGKEGQIAINYRNYIGWQDPTNLPDFLGSLDFLKYSEKSQDEVDKYAADMAKDPYKYPDTDWNNLLFSENGFQQYHNISASGGSEKAKVVASLGYLDQDGNVKGYNYKRYNGRFNSDLKINDKLDVNFDLSFSKSERQASVYDLRYTVMEAFRLAPVYPYMWADGSWADGFSGANPIAKVNEGGYNNSSTNSFKGLVKLNYQPVKGLKFSAMYAPSYDDRYEKYFSKTFEQVIDPDSHTARKVNDPNQLKQTNKRPFTQNFNAVASYSIAFNQHDISALAGYEFIKYKYEDFTAGRQDFVLQNYEVLNAGSEELDFTSGSATHWGLVSYFGRLNYSFQSKYLLEANLRRDASSRFHSSKRVGVFPSFSAGWRISEEGFMKNLTFLSNLKLRASWGSLGNQAITENDNFPYASSILLGGTNYLFGDKIVTGASPSVMANKNIKWETTEVTNLGIDGGAFNQRLTFSFDYYIRKTKDILLRMPIPTVIGLGVPIQNIGDIENKGWDFNLNWQDQVGDISYSAKINISDVRNKATYLGGSEEIINGNTITKLGKPIHAIYGYETIGIFQSDEEAAAAPKQFGKLQAGNLQYKDQLTIDTDGDDIPDKGDGVINASDRVMIGDPFPRLTYGLDLFAAYKGLDVSVSMLGVGKRDIFLTGDLVLPLYNAGKIQQWHTEKCWTPDRRDATYPILAPTSIGSNDNQVSNTWVFNGAYLRVRNITVGYTLPSKWLDKASIKNLRVYFSGQNLLTFDKLPDGVDPLTPNGSAGASYPITKNYTFGVDLTF